MQGKSPKSYRLPHHRSGQHCSRSRKGYGSAPPDLHIGHVDRRRPTNGWTESTETAGPHPTSPTALAEEPMRWRAANHDTAVTWFSPTTPPKASSTGLSQMEPVSKSLPWGLVRHSWNLHTNWQFLKV